jgi:hypothetical protein
VHGLFVGVAAPLVGEVGDALADLAAVFQRAVRRIPSMRAEATPGTQRVTAPRSPRIAHTSSGRRSMMISLPIFAIRCLLWSGDAD